MELTILDERKATLALAVGNFSRQIKTIVSLREAKDLTTKAKLLGDMMRDLDMDDEIKKELAVSNVLVVREMGELIKAMQESGELASRDRFRGNRFVDSTNLELSTPTLADFGITKKQSSQAQKLASLSHDEAEALANARAAQGKTVSPATIAKVVDMAVKKARTEERTEKKRIDNKPSTTIDIYHCSISELHSVVAPNSIDAIITDPPYPKEFLYTYQLLSEFAAYALRDGGVCLAMAGQSYLPDVMAMMSSNLTYHWMINYNADGGDNTRIFPRRVFSSWKPVLMYVKGEYTGDWFDDFARSSHNDKDHHHWGQSEKGIGDLVSIFSYPNQLVCDPFVGGGTTAVVCRDMKRRFVGCDIDLANVEKSIGRVSNE